MGEKTGLLLVHGIGSQARGSVLTSAVDPLTTWLRHRYGNDLVTLDSVRLGLGQDGEPGPARAELELPNDRTWVVVESRWAENFIPPGFRRIVGWTLAAVTRAATREVVLLVSQHGTSAQDDKGRDRGSLFDPLRPDVTRFPNLARRVRAIMLLASLPIALAGLIATSVLRFFPPLRTTVDRVQSALSATIGDSYVFVADRTGRAAMVQQVREDLVWLRDQDVSRIVVAAHSQGAAVAYDALRTCWCKASGQPQCTGACDDERVDLLTYGAGIDKLTTLTQGTHLEWWRVALAPILGLFFAIAVSLLAASTFDMLTSNAESSATKAWVIAWICAGALVSGAIIWYSALLYPFWRWKGSKAVARTILVLTGLAFWGVLMSNNWVITVWGSLMLVLGYFCCKALYTVDIEDRTPQTAPRLVQRWWNASATSDPVASSAKPYVGIGEDLVYRQDLHVHNLRSIVLDHTSYWHNWSEFIPVVINAMASGTDAPPNEASVPRFWTLRERSRRYEWTWILADTRLLVALGCVAALVATLQQLPTIGYRALHAYAKLSAQWRGSGGDLPRRDSPRDDLLGVALVVLCFAVAYALTSAAWHRWQARSQRELVEELKSLHALRDQWPTWRALVRCELQENDTRKAGWLVLCAEGSDVDAERKLCWLPTAVPTADTELDPLPFQDAVPTSPDGVVEARGEGPSRATRIKLNRSSRNELCLRLTDDTRHRRFTTRSLRAMAHLERVAFDRHYR